MGWTGPLAALTDLTGPLDWVAGARLLLAAVFGGIVGWERERLELMRRPLANHSLEVLSYVVNRDEGTALYELQLRHARPVDFERVTNELADGLTGEGIKKIEWS